MDEVEPLPKLRPLEGPPLCAICFQRAVHLITEVASDPAKTRSRWLCEEHAKGYLPDNPAPRKRDSP